MKKETNNDHIDVLDASLRVWNEKWKLVLITFLTVTTTLIYINFKKPETTYYLASTKIKPISIFDEFLYENFNNYIDVLRQKKLMVESLLTVTQRKDSSRLLYLLESNIRQIDKDYLMELFIDTLDEGSVLIEAINKSEYETDEEKLMSSIKIIKNNSDNTYTAQYTVTDKLAWEKYLYHLNVEANNKVRKFLEGMIDSRLIIEKKQHENQNEGEKIDNADIKTLTKYYQATPIKNSNKFESAKILYEFTKYSPLNKPTSNKKLLILSLFAGIFFGLIFIFFSEAIKSKNSHK
jgi:LPS O-antigen subunit length determinant protein (WzzB/FepE family)